MKSETIEVTISCERSSCSIPVTFDPKVAFGKVRAPVKVTINGFTFRSTIARMGGKTFIPLRKNNRISAGVKKGDGVLVTIEADTEVRVVEVPSDLADALKENEGLWNKWSKLSYTLQRESVESVMGAKRVETRRRRIQKVKEFVTSKEG